MKKTLVDVLLAKSNFKTIKYNCVIKKYIYLANQTTDKVEKVLYKLSDRRNTITILELKFLIMMK